MDLHTKLFHSEYEAHECSRCRLRCFDLRRYRTHYCLGHVPSRPRNHFDLTPSDDYRKTGNESILDQVGNHKKSRISTKLISWSNRTRKTIPSTMSTRTISLLNGSRVYAAVLTGLTVVLLTRLMSWINIRNFITGETVVKGSTSTLSWPI